MRRLSDGVKTTDRYKTTEQVERAFVEDSNFSLSLQGSADGFTFMNGETYDQIIVPDEVLGDQAAYLQEGDDLRGVDVQRASPWASSCRRA